MLAISRRLLGFITSRAAERSDPHHRRNCAADRFECFAIAHSDTDAKWYYERAAWPSRD
jgi:hypothetical protein